MQTASERYQLFCRKQEGVFEDIVRAYTSKEISAIEAWNRIPCHPLVRYQFGNLNVTSPFQGSHTRFLEDLYMDLVRQAGMVVGGRPILSVEFSRQHLPSDRKNAEDAEFKKISEEAMLEGRNPKRTTYRTQDYDDERIANIIRKVLQEDRVWS